VIIVKHQAWDGEWLGAQSFISFDKSVFAVLKKQGIAARLLEQRSVQNGTGAVQYLF
jgi:hypothetical protein